MKLGIMQPYFFPYIGYWQLINSVDEYLIMEDLNYIKQGFINRNYILIRGNPHRFTLELVGASQNKLINEIHVGNNRGKLLTTFEVHYKNAPHFNDAFPVIKSILEYPEDNLAGFITNSIRMVSEYLGLTTKILTSADITRNRELRSGDMVLDLCKQLGAKQYINSIGGIKLYSKEVFKEQNVDLYFLKSDPIEYNQLGSTFVPNLSIVDVMMFNSKDEISELLEKYELI